MALSLLELGARHGHEVIPISLPHLNLVDPGDLVGLFGAARPDAIISAAAYTAVDQAEQEPETAMAVNAAGAGTVARAASELGVKLVHISTDYVFDGAKPAPYVEEDSCAPINAYGRSKLAGEQAVWQAYGEETAILRAAWIFSPFGKNFARTMLRLAGEMPLLKVVDDQMGNPTSALDLAGGVIKVAENLVSDSAAELRGIFHLTSAGATSWAGFAREILAQSALRGGPSAEVAGIPSAQYPTPARRPANSQLDCQKIAVVHGVRLPHWREGTAHVISRLIAGSQSAE